MKGKRALVTGGTGGIGVATANALAVLGADVGVTGRDRGEAVVAALKAAGGGDAHLVLGDLTSHHGVDAIAAGCAAVGAFDGRTMTTVSSSASPSTSSRRCS